MLQSGIVTLLSDFGTADVYVGVMKGAIASVNPNLTLIDLAHQIAPQKLLQARFAMMNAFPYFPQGTVHLAVVDPGVGSQRRGVALAVGTDPDQPAGYLVGPDNGIFSGVLDQYPVIAAVELNNPVYWRTNQPSFTFHGRDIFAPVSAHLASGVALERLGTAIAPESLIQLPLEPFKQEKNCVSGCIQATDHFGNGITNIPATAVSGESWSVIVGNQEIPSASTYCDRPDGEPVALIGSHGWVELAIAQGNAQAAFRLNPGDPIQVVLKGGQ